MKNWWFNVVVALVSMSWCFEASARYIVLDGSEGAQLSTRTVDVVGDFLGLGAVRFYPSESGRFISPDPLFLERPDLCVSDIVSCNLFSYAKNNPLQYVDPTGNLPILAPLAVLAAPFATGSAVYEGIVAHQQATSPEMGAKLAEGRATFHGTMLGGATLATAPLTTPAAAGGATKLGSQAATTMTDASIRTYVMGSSALTAAGNKAVDVMSQPWASNAVNGVANMTQTGVARIQQGVMSTQNYVLANPHTVADRANNAIDFVDNLGIEGLQTGSLPETTGGRIGVGVGKFYDHFVAPHVNE